MAAAPPEHGGHEGSADPKKLEITSPFLIIAERIAKRNNPFPFIKANFQDGTASTHKSASQWF